MGLLDKVANLREKANRLGVDTDVDQRRQDRNAEARGRLDAGRQTLTAIMDGNTEQLRSRVSALAGQGEAVGKLTQVMADVAPVLQQHTAELQQVVQQIDSAKAELGAAGQLPQAAGRVEAAMGSLLDRANLPANVMPRNVLADLVHDATEDNTPRTNNNTEVPAPASTSSAANAPAPGTGKRKKRRGDDDAGPTATGRGTLRDVARKTGFLDSFRAPSNIASIVSNPAAAESAMSSLTSAPGAAVNSAVASLTSAPAAAVNTAISSAVGGLGGLGGLGGGGIAAPASSSSNSGLVDRATPATSEKQGNGGASKALGILGGAVRAFGIDTGPVSIDGDGVSLTAGGDSANASVTLGPDGDVSVSGELSRETPLGTVSLGAEHSLTSGTNTLTAGLAHDTPLGEVALKGEVDDDAGSSVSIDTPAGSIPLMGGGDSNGEGGGLAGAVSEVLNGGGLGGAVAGLFGGHHDAAAPAPAASAAPAAPTATTPTPAPPAPASTSAGANAPAPASDTDFSDVAAANNAGGGTSAFLQPASFTPGAQPAGLIPAAYMQPSALLQPASLTGGGAAPGALQPAVNRGRTFDTARAVRTARSDNAHGGQCAKGVANVLSAQGFPVTRGNATDWWRTLPQNGWSKLEGATPSSAPEGAVLVYTNNRQAGRRVTRRKGGQLYGHVEIVGISNGQRVYISDAVRSNWGGTVPQNFKGAYVYGQNAAAAPQLLQAANRSPGEAAAPAQPAAAPAAPPLAGADTMRIA